MPFAAKRPCAWPGCRAAVRPPIRFCPAHEARAREEHRAADRLRGSAAKRGYGTPWRELRAAFLRRHPLCAVTGCGAQAAEVHHRVPRRRGGTDAESNLVGLCKPHHTAASNRERIGT
jgi:5-methylcytosine-specific restriction protein A